MTVLCSVVLGPSTPAASAPVTPFLSTILKQRGYSPVVVGALFTVLPVPGLLLRPFVGSLTDRYRCRKPAIIVNACATVGLVCVLLFAPGAAAGVELDDADVVRSPMFWLFSTTVVLFFTGTIVRTVLEDTICVDLLGRRPRVTV